MCRFLLRVSKKWVHVAQLLPFCITRPFKERVEVAQLIARRTAGFGEGGVGIAKCRVPGGVIGATKEWVKVAQIHTLLSH